MSHLYRCDPCGCYLDPGEGRKCEDCMKESSRRAERTRRMMASVRIGDRNQYEMNMEELA